MALFSTSTVPSRQEAKERFEEIRRKMTDLASSCGGRASSGLAMRIHYASDVQALWFMRSELMALLAQSQGESAARQELARLGDMFSGILPDGLRSRPSPLDEGPGHGEGDSMHR